MPQSIHICAKCGASNVSVLKDSKLLVCRECKETVYENVNENPGRSIPPPDWSFIQLKTSFEYSQQTYTIIGRIRLQLRNDYKNIWCASPGNGNYIWLMESFASFAILLPQWYQFEGNIGKLHAGNDYDIVNDLTVTGEYVEKCEGMCYEGECGDWRLFHPGFFVIQSSGPKGDTAIFVADKKQNITYLIGRKVERENLKLTNTVSWDEWKQH